MDLDTPAAGSDANKSEDDQMVLKDEPVVQQQQQQNQSSLEENQVSETDEQQPQQEAVPPQTEQRVEPSQAEPSEASPADASLTETQSQEQDRGTENQESADNTTNAADVTMDEAQNDQTVNTNADANNIPENTETPGSRNHDVTETDAMDVTASTPAVQEGDPKETHQEMPTPNAPASWQIPVAALQQPKNEPKTEAPRINQKRERLEQRIKESTDDVDAWTALIADIQQTGDLAAIRDVFERFLQVFPTSVSILSYHFFDIIKMVSPASLQL
ncbi:uncharacterized protein BYT42DRAFT_563415 [Radiomyces spectabilis]|uniref:uncharacterized protein n=1 Tax=Radiomyces spectabilis TaxID=64574 RepID=UPI00221F8F1C|nr:uncharacterized protein BYT42DRAFT_563415 [Radiomyces spectabilis]KAI8384709.1 hypothetical protein BYT42DRAFT_563415 [Radiomyces spectabilis]